MFSLLGRTRCISQEDLYGDSYTIMTKHVIETDILATTGEIYSDLFNFLFRITLI